MTRIYIIIKFVSVGCDWTKCSKPSCCMGIIRPVDLPNVVFGNCIFYIYSGQYIFTSLRGGKIFFYLENREGKNSHTFAVDQWKCKIPFFFSLFWYFVKVVFDFHGLTLEMYTFFTAGQTPNLNWTFELDILHHGARENWKVKNRKKSEDREEKICG